MERKRIHRRWLDKDWWDMISALALLWPKEDS